MNTTTKIVSALPEASLLQPETYYAIDGGVDAGEFILYLTDVNKVPKKIETLSNEEKTKISEISAIKDKITNLETKTDKFVKDIVAERTGNNITFHYTFTDGESKDITIEDKDTVSLAYDDSALQTKINELKDRVDGHDTKFTSVESRLNTLEAKADNDTVYDDTDIKNRLQTVETKNTEQDTKLQELEGKNTEQDAKISALENKANESVGSWS